MRPLTVDDLVTYVPLRVRPRLLRWRYAWTIYRLCRRNDMPRRVALGQWWLAMTWMPEKR